MIFVSIIDILVEEITLKWFTSLSFKFMIASKSNILNVQCAPVSQGCLRDILNYTVLKC